MVQLLGGGWPWVSCKLSPVFSPPGWLLTDYYSAQSADKQRAGTPARPYIEVIRKLYLPAVSVLSVFL